MLLMQKPQILAHTQLLLTIKKTSEEIHIHLLEIVPCTLRTMASCVFAFSYNIIMPITAYCIAMCACLRILLTLMLCSMNV